MHQATHPQQKSIHHPVLVKGLAMLAAATCALAGGLICTQPALAQEISATDTSDSATTTPIDSNSDKQSTAGLISHAAAREQKNAGIDAYSAFPDNWQMSSGMPSAGNAHVLVLRVDFPDMHFDSDDTLEALQADIDGSAGTAPFESLKAFYGRSSYGKLHIDGKAYGYTASKPRSSYTVTHAACSTRRCMRLTIKSITASSTATTTARSMRCIYISPARTRDGEAPDGPMKVSRTHPDMPMTGSMASSCGTPY